MKINIKRLLLFVFFYSYIIYPSYYMGGIKTKFSLFSLYLFLFWILGRIIPKQEGISLSIPYLKYLSIPFFSVILCHLYFWSLPVPTAEDFQVYCGVPAVFLYKISRYVPYGLLIILSVIALGISYIYLLGKGRKIWYMFFAFGLFIGLSLIFFIPESITEIMHRKEIVIMNIFRHPPIPKTLYLLGYIFFGINEWVGNFIQFFLLSAAGIYVGKITQLILEKKELFPFISGFSITLFFPTFFHFTNLCGLTGGELFFLAASFYYLLCFFSSYKEEDLFYCNSILAIGLLYERRILFLFLFILLVLGIKRKFSFSILKYLLIPLIFGIPFILVSYQYRNASLYFLWIENPKLIFLNAKQIWLSLSPIIVLFTIISFFFLKRYKILFSSFFLFYYIFISSTGAVGYIRHAQPYYLVLAIVLSAGIAQTKRIFLFLLILIMLYQATCSSSPLLFNLSNYKSKKWTAGFGILPYRETICYVKKNLLEDTKIYAPMGCGEPSRFYLAKFKVKWERWIREPTTLKDIDIASLYKWCKENQIDYLVLPLSGDEEYLAEIVNLSLCREIYNPNAYFRLKKSFFFGENCLFLSEVR